MKFEYDTFYATAHSYLRAVGLIELPRNYFQDGCPASLICNVQTWRKSVNSRNTPSATIWLKIFRSDTVVGLYPLSQTFHWRKPNRHFRSPTLYVLLPLGRIFVFCPLAVFVYLKSLDREPLDFFFWPGKAWTTQCTDWIPTMSFFSCTHISVNLFENPSVPAINGRDMLLYSAW